MDQKRVGFLSNKLTLRGTEIALYDYADFNETLLNNKSIIITRNYNLVQYQKDTSLEAYLKFKKRFQVEYYQSQQDIDQIVIKHNLTHLYIIKAGIWDGLVTSISSCKNLIHCVFNPSQPHGDVYSVISSDVNRLYNSNWPVVPHMIRNGETKENLRKELNIPDDYIVFGRYGGPETFDLDFVHKAIVDLLKTDTKIYFLFMNTEEFPNSNHPRIIFLKGTTDMEFKKKFINTCDAYLHARRDGESFGLSCGEFAMELKPIITWNGSREHNHINILNSQAESLTLRDSNSAQAVLYSDYESIYNILKTFKRGLYSMESNGYLEYSPKNIMNIFNNVYLKDEPNNPVSEP